MVFGLYKQWYSPTLNIKTDFESYKICDVSITLMTSCVGDVVNKLRKRCIGCLHFFKYKLRSIQSHRVQSLHRKRGRNSGLGVFSRRIAVVFASFAAILKKIFVGELKKSFFKNKKRLCGSIKTSSSGSTYISLITECFADA